MSTYFISGINKGIGLALAAKLLSQGHRVLGTYRTLSPALSELKKNHATLSIFKMDVNDETSIEKVKKEIQVIDVLINNAGVLTEYNVGLEELSLAEVQKTFEVNVLGTMRVTRAFLPLLQRSGHPKIITISSKVGSIADNTSGFAYGYRMSKTALNMFNKSLSIEFSKITCVVLHPGWVQTDMGGMNAPTTPQESASGLAQVIESLSLRDTGKFFDFRGETIPW
ncbi:SDR family oxidoreductase [bacterium]|nr:SDR family oxidoreductase [bacterium]